MLMVVAMLTMTIDHIGWAFASAPLMTVLRTIGRIAFPLYAFMLAEGFFHIRNKPERIRAHAIRLAGLSVVSEFAFDLMKGGKLVDFACQSVMLTLLLGFVGLVITEKLRQNPPAVMGGVLLLATISYLLRTDYLFIGVLLVVWFYWFTTTWHDVSFWKRTVVLTVMMTVYCLLTIWMYTGFELNVLEQRSIEYASWLLGNWMAVPLIASYDGRLGHRSAGFRHLYHAYYPLHMAIIGITKMLL